MSRKKFEALFPMTVEVTGDILDNADLRDTKNCIGSLALRKGLGEKGLDFLINEQQGWGVESGCQNLKEGKSVYINSFNKFGEPVDMMEIKKPQTVIFKVGEE